MGASAAAAIILRKERELMDHFRASGAMSPSTAKSLDEMGVSEAFALSRLRDRAVIREAAPGRYYLDEEVWNAVRGMRQRMVMILVTVIIFAGLFVWMGTVTLR